jgi:hypothetical protein
MKETRMLLRGNLWVNANLPEEFLGRTVKFTDSPRGFLAAERSETPIAKIRQNPDVSLLRYLPGISRESGLVYFDSTWYLIRGESTEIDLQIVYDLKRINILLHSHSSTDPFPLPSFEDFASCPSSKTKNFLATSQGLIQYWAIRSKSGKKTYASELHLKFGEHDRDSSYLARYKLFLETIQAPFKLSRWQDLDSSRLNELFYDDN